VLVALWSAKGGSGTTVVSVALAAVLARASSAGAVLADLDGDVPAALGLPEPSGPGLADWLAAGPDVPPDALRRIETDSGARGLRLLPAGAAPAEPAGDDRGAVLAAVLAADPRPVVADCGSVPSGPALAVASAASHSLLVTRPCYLSLRRALACSLRPSGVIVVDEPGRALGPDDVESALGAPVRAVVPVTEGIARAVDAGLLGTRIPRALERAVRRAA
jgi:MinD-like ATPase involved in chromosome partitioning or flagellar assembly